MEMYARFPILLGQSTVDDQYMTQTGQGISFHVMECLGDEDS